MWLPALTNILPPDLRRKKALVREYEKIMQNDKLPIHEGKLDPPWTRLKSRHPSMELAEQLRGEDFDPVAEWAQIWNEKGHTSELYGHGTDRTSDMHLGRRVWCNLNRLRTDHG